MRSLTVNILLIFAASAAIILLLKKGGDAGVSKIKQVTAPASKVADAPIRPHAIQARIDAFNEPITLQPVESWGAKPKYGFLLGTGDDSGSGQRRARLTFAHPPAAETILQLEYTIPEDFLEKNTAKAEAGNESSSMAIQVSAQGSNSTSYAILNLAPLWRPNGRKWLSCNLIVPTGAKEVQFAIAGVSGDSNTSSANCAISLPQLQVVPADTSAAPAGE